MKAIKILAFAIFTFLLLTCLMWSAFTVGILILMKYYVEAALISVGMVLLLAVWFKVSDLI